MNHYNNFDGSLKVLLLSSKPNTKAPVFFTIGSTKDEVLAVQGTPTRVLHRTWYYGFSQIRFQEERVVSYDNFFGNLKIRMLPSVREEPSIKKAFFTIGSSRDEVLSVQGTPTSVQGNMWFYGFSNILFRNGRVKYVLDSDRRLHFQEPDT